MNFILEFLFGNPERPQSHALSKKQNDGSSNDLIESFHCLHQYDLTQF